MEKSICRLPKDKNNPYTQISKAAIESVPSAEAGWVLINFLSLRDNCRICLSRVRKMSGLKRTRFDSAKKELEMAGFLRLTREASIHLNSKTSKFNKLKVEVFEHPSLNPYHTLEDIGLNIFRQECCIRAREKQEAKLLYLHKKGGK